MSKIKEEIASNIKKAIEDLNLDKSKLKNLDISLQVPKEENHGDYASNIAMVLWANQECKNPFELAKKIVNSIIRDSQFMIHFDRVEAVAPGFINFWLSGEYLINALSKSQSLEKTLRGKKIMVEFTDPNPFKEFHIGHLYSNTVGESISRLLEASGAVVKRANYQGDVGMHVAKGLYGVFQLCHAEFISASKILENKILKQVQDDNLSKRIKFLGEAYALGSKVYEEDKDAKLEIEELNKKIYDKDEAIMAFYEKGRQWSLEYFETIYQRLGTKFDFYYFESEVGIEGLELIKKYLEKGVFKKSQGAVIFPGKKQNLHDRVFINSLGLPTYEAKELGLALKKYRDFEFDQSIVITGNEIVGYFKVLLAALGKINPDLASKTKHLPHGIVRLPSGKMSSRSGNILTGEWLLDEAKKVLKNKYSEMEEDTLEKVAVGSVKYALLKSSVGHDIEFDFEGSINMQGNSGPYLQYTYARTQSVLGKAKKDLKKDLASQGWTLQGWEGLEKEESSILRTLNLFPEIVEEAGEKFTPNLLCNYLFDLAQKFNLFYQMHSILNPEVSSIKHIGGGNEATCRDFRVFLTAGVGQVLKNGLSLLGIQAPKKM